MWFLGMDVGTGGTRAVVVDAAGQIVSGEDWWRAAQEAIHFALAAAPEPHQPIAAIGLTGQMHGAVMLDENGQVSRAE